MVRAKAEGRLARSSVLREMDKRALAKLRREYSLRELSRSTVESDPFAQFTIWMDEALTSEVIDPTAMTLSTADASGRPSARVVLLKGYDAAGFVFFTNYESQKGGELSINPQAALSFYWPDLERQVTISGTAEKTSREGSEAYFATRPAASRISAWASKQSEPLSDRHELDLRVAEIRKRFDGGEILCPPFWGGYRVFPDRFEFWQGRPDRLHDRICYTRNRDTWSITRLSP